MVNKILFFVNYNIIDNDVRFPVFFFSAGETKALFYYSN